KCAPGTFALRCGFKLLQRAFGGKVPPAAAGAFNQCFLNPYKRRSLGERSPFELFAFMYGEELLECLLRLL
ncbi:MAG: hypothetical protein LUE91_00700, partial [Oscillospiraceae bacterium]|nr:hypothetical protein [Oscillospiraceae bacterium]